MPPSLTLPKFHDRSLLERALTHRSFANENSSAGKHNERLEFLGDAVLNFLSGEFLYKRYPNKSEGELTPLRSALVDAKQLAKFAEALNLGQQIKLGKGADREGGRQNVRLLSSTFEALIGAYFLDTNSDINQVRSYVEPFFNSVVNHLVVVAPNINFKSRFQEWALANPKENPQYVIVSESGPDHAKHFVAEVQVANKTYGRGNGHKKQEAEKDAARDALDRLGLI
ncbi:ribonuclease III [Pantanalinema sp. GBBB05]|uniref:ribonuclease III n=1 Tax=Pantanalinema sp. GBBB05 TaxID=2604139 RepID=UPI001D69B810|nr:ribonuclease III [Pantanalinema sp. GBBB05]